MDLAETLAEYVFRDILPEDLKAVAHEMIVAGYESTSLAVLAGAERCLPASELRDLFEQALRAMGVELPTLLAAGELLKRRCARQVLNGTLRPKQGAERIVDLNSALERELSNPVHYVGDSFGVAAIVDLYYSFDGVAADDAATLTSIEQSIVAACALILAD